jgi:hypothetical protein
MGASVIDVFSKNSISIKIFFKNIKNEEGLLLS